MVPQYTAKVPYLGEAIRHQELEYHRKKRKRFSFGDAFWTPPLAPRQAYRLEEKQIQRKFKLPALISLTDHDDIPIPGGGWLAPGRALSRCIGAPWKGFPRNTWCGCEARPQSENPLGLWWIAKRTGKSFLL